MTRVQADFLLKFWVDEVPSGTIDGTNVTFTIANEPSESAAVDVYKNGLRQEPTTHYSISGATITFVDPPAVASTILVSYVRRRGE